MSIASYEWPEEEIFLADPYPQYWQISVEYTNQKNCDYLLTTSSLLIDDLVAQYYDSGN